MESSGQVVLITGGARGIGKVLAERCAAAGHSVAINYLSSEAAARELVDRITQAGLMADAFAADVGRAEGASDLVRQTIERFGRIDVLVNNAGIGQIRKQPDADEAHFDETIRVNVKSAFLMTQAVVPQMMERRSGRLVFFSSLAARTGGVVSPAYAASKAALEGLMHYYATYLLPYHITSNAIAPALVESDMTRQMQLPPAAQLPLGRLGRSEEMWPALEMI